jgi:hypothetical protein
VTEVVAANGQDVGRTATLVAVWKVVALEGVAMAIVWWTWPRVTSVSRRGTEKWPASVSRSG